jgi:hypothetical protein
MLVSLPGATARAQSESMLAAKKHFDQAQALYLQSRFAAAAERFLRAHDARPYPAFLFNMAVCLERAGDYASAAEQYQRFVEADPKSSDRAMVEARIAVLRKHVGIPSQGPTSAPSAGVPSPSPGEAQPATSLPAAPPLSPPEPRGVVVIESEPSGAALRLSSRGRTTTTRTPFAGSLAPGRHVAVLRLGGHAEQRKAFDVRNDRMMHLFFGLARKHVPSQPREPQATPLYKRWWFWTAVGVVVAAAATATIVATRPEDVEPGWGTLRPGQIPLSLRGPARR